MTEKGANRFRPEPLRRMAMHRPHPPLLAADYELGRALATKVGPEGPKQIDQLAVLGGRE